MDSTPTSSWNLTSGKEAADEALFSERKTILLYNQAEPMAEVYTHDPRLMEKLELLAKKHPDQITRKDAHNFTVPKRCVSVREPYSAERRKAASERAKAAGYQPPVRKSSS